MTTNVTDYIDVSSKAIDLGCRCPTGIALLPINFDSALSIDELLQASETVTIKKLFAAEGIAVDEIVGKSQRLPYVKNKSFDWAAPVIFISASLYSQNPALVSIALSVLANYATEFFKGMGKTDEVSLNIVTTKKNGACKKVAYKGPIDGLKTLADVIREISNE